ncbi:uncharacterized protein LOC143287277 [Babylonia areolata]|uniref:uncharacterized protein LOC143287277 n=1 Tax=Babylonia areolata TaxID=304850 RepID=UPI003FD4F8FB
MADADNVSVRSGSTHTVGTGAGGSDITGSSAAQSLVVIPFTPASDAVQSHLPSASTLPSRKFQFSVWHELRSSMVHGTELKAPRVRRGPAEKEKAFYLMVDEDNNKLHHDLRGQQRRHHRDTLESWERAQLASFPCQELQHGYQEPNSDRILDRLRDVIFLNLRDNALQDLSSYSFPRCEYLNLDNNYLVSFMNLPRLNKVHHLTMMDNDIAVFFGLDRLRSLPLEELFLMGNPIAFQLGYRQRVFAALPQLKFLDGVVKQEEDMEPPPPTPPSRPGQPSQPSQPSESSQSACLIS